MESRRYQSLMERLQDWALAAENRTWLERATKTFFPQVGGYADGEMEWLHWAFLSWLLNDYVDTDGRTARDRFAATAEPSPSSSQLKLLAQLGRERFRLVEVQQVREGEGMSVKDLFTGELFYIQERLATRSLRLWDLLLVRLRRLSTHYELDAACSVPRTVRLPWLARIDRLHRGLLNRQPRARLEDVLRVKAPQVFAALLDVLRKGKSTRVLRTTDGDRLIFCTGRFEVLEEQALRQALAAHRSLSEDEQGWRWISGVCRKGSLAGVRVSLGQLHLRNGELILETTSRPRLERGKRMLSQLGPGLLQHRLDIFEDSRHVLERSRLTRGQSEGDLVNQELSEDFLLHRHFELWLDEPISTLEGLTPRQAAEHEDLRPRLEDLLKDLENQNLRSKSSGRFDFDTLRQQLGLVGEDV